MAHSFARSRPSCLARRLFVLVLVLVALGQTRSALGAGDLVVPTGEDLVLDGRSDEAAWEKALTLEVAAVEIPALEDGDATSLEPVVRVLTSGERLWIAVTADEPPGPGIGLAFRVALDGSAETDALAAAFAPQSVRGLRWVVQGPRGSSRDGYRVEGAAHVADAKRWSLEVAVPFADLGLPNAVDALRLAVCVRTRAPALVTWCPPSAAFAGSGNWARLLPDGAWPTGDVKTDTDRLREEDELDDARLQAWGAFTVAYRDAALKDLLAAVGIQGDPTLELTDEALLSTFRQTLVAPLERISTLRPDLAIAHVVRGSVLRQLGLDDEARRAYESALAIAPGYREARFGLHLELHGPAFARGETGGPTRYAEAVARVESAAAEAQDVYARDAARLGRGRLLYASGSFEEATALFGPLAKRYPFTQAIVFAASHALRARETWPLEQHYRETEAKADDLPRVRLVTSKGAIVLELLEDDASNTVKNFVWLAQNGFYDGTAFHRTVPFLLVHGGDPSTRREPASGDRGPGWAIPTLRAPKARSPDAASKRRRRTWRGSIAMLSDARDAAGSQFVLLTGTAPDVEGDLMPFGRVVVGQEVLEALTAGDRIERAVVLRTRPGTEYRPLTVEGTPAPVPR